MTRRRVFAATVASTLLLAAWVRLGPIPADLLDPHANTSALVVDRNGVPLYEALSESGTRGVAIDAANLPPTVVAATLAVEDRRFFAHAGVDLIAIVRALKTNLAERRIVEGGSTISQQVAKLLLNRKDPGRRRSFLAKVYEAALALRLEHRYAKPELLAMYLNLASYGSQIVGVERASDAYFGVRASMLTPAQAALLAGLPQRPSDYNPYRNKDGTLARQRTVLRRMAAAGALSDEALRQALEERLSFAHSNTPFKTPHFVAMVLAGIGGNRPARIETTIDSALQADIAGIIESHRPVLERHGATNVAVVVLDNARAEWLAWEGSGNYFDRDHGGTINGPVMPRQPGSALKPFTYAAAFEQGFTPATVLADVPSHFPTAETGIVYSPRNYDGKYRGPLLARRALAGSENVPAVAVASEIGVPNLLRFLGRAGFTTFDKNAAHYGLGVTLGNAEVRLDELVAAYSSFARGGEWIRPTYLRVPVGEKRERRGLVSPRTAFWITDVLSDPEAREFVFGRGGSLEFAFPVAVKTGTSQAYHDNWTIGYSRDVTIGVWVGNFDRRPLRNSSGVTGAAPIFHAAMLAATNRVGRAADPFDRHPIVEPPHTVQSAKICALSGMAANAWCPTKQIEWVAAEAPPLPCSWHHLAEVGLLTFVPTQYQLPSDSRQPLLPMPALRASRLSAARGFAPAPFRIANPPEGATYLIDPTLRREFQTLPLRVVSTSGGPIEWSVNGEPVGSSASHEPLTWPLTKGEHRFVARDSKGQTAEATITVR